MNRLFLKYLLEKNVSQENLAFINSIRSNSNLRAISLQEVAAPPRRRPPTPGMLTNPTYYSGIPTAYQSNYQTQVVYDQFGNPLGWTPSQGFLAMLARHEGYQLTSYDDTDNPPKRTIGYGINIDSASNKEYLIKLWARLYGVTEAEAREAFNRIHAGHLSITPEFAELLLQNSLNVAIQDCYRLFGGQERFMQLPQAIQDMMVNLSYNMGYNSFSQFKSAIAAILAGNWVEAARQFLYRNPNSRDPEKRYELSGWARDVRFGAPGTTTPGGRRFTEYGSRAWEILWIIAHGGVYYDPAIHGGTVIYIGAPSHYSNPRETAPPKPSPINLGTTRPRDDDGGQGGGGQGGGGQGGGGQGGGGQGGGGQGGGGTAP